MYVHDIKYFCNRASMVACNNFDQKKEITKTSGEFNSDSGCKQATLDVADFTHQLVLIPLLLTADPHRRRLERCHVRRDPGLRRCQGERWHQVLALFFIFRPFPRSVPLELRLKGKLRATVKVKFEDGPLTLLCFSVFQTVLKTCKTQLKAAILYFLSDIFCAIHRISCISAHVKATKVNWAISEIESSGTALSKHA